MKAMILAAGLGTRLKPLTNNLPKALVKIKGIPMLELLINKLKSTGVTDIIINVHHFASQIIDFIKANKSFGINIFFSDESDGLLDTGGAIKNASYFFDDKSFFLHNVDVLSDINLLDLYRTHLNSGAMATLAVKNRPTSRLLLFDENTIWSVGKIISPKKLKWLKNRNLFLRKSLLVPFK